MTLSPGTLAAVGAILRHLRAGHHLPTTATPAGLDIAPATIRDLARDAGLPFDDAAEGLRVALLARLLALVEGWRVGAADPCTLVLVAAAPHASVLAAVELLQPIESYRDDPQRLTPDAAARVAALAGLEPRHVDAIVPHLWRRRALVLGPAGGTR